MERKRFVEIRWGSRYKFGSSAELCAPGMAVGAATIRDASLSGAFVETSAELPLFTRVSVRTIMQPCDWLDACVVRNDSEGVALRWLNPGLRPISNLMPARINPQPRMATAETHWG